MKPDVKQDWTDKLRESMSDYQEQPSDKVWAGISHRAGVSGRRSIPVWLWGSCAAAALATGIFFAFDAIDDKSGKLTADNIAVIPTEGSHPDTIQYESLDETAEQSGDGDAISEIDSNENKTISSATTQNTKIGNNNIGGASNKNVDKTGYVEGDAQNIPAEEARRNKDSEMKTSDTSTTSGEALEGDAGNTESDGNATETAGMEDGADSKEAEEDADNLGSLLEKQAVASEDSNVQESNSESGIEEETADESEADAWKRYLSENQEKTKRKRGIFSASILANGAGEATGREKIRMSGVLGSNPLEPDASTGWIDPEFSNNGAAMLTDNVPEIEMEYIHKMPIKIGLSVRYDIGQRFGIETGIAYSILNSDIKRGKNLSTWSKGEQTFNYIGIPLNVSFDIFSSRFVDFYVSAGGMMEKAVRGRINLDNYTDGKYVNSTKRSIKPKELEWSANGAVGVQCNILPKLGIFVEPGISYHFKSNASVRTIYTDKPTNFTIGFGLRWTFLD